MIFCNRQLSSLQRRSMQLFGSILLLMAAASYFAGQAFQHGYPASRAAHLIAILPAIPVVLLMVTAARYLASETDEFIKSIVMQSLLWGFGITMVADVLLCGLTDSQSLARLLPIFSIDIFCVAVGFAIRIQLWRSR